MQKGPQEDHSTEEEAKPDTKLKALQIEKDLRSFLRTYGIVQNIRAIQMGADVAISATLRPFNLDSESEMEIYREHHPGQIEEDEDLLGEDEN